MKIGIISDTHDNIEITRKACSVFKDKKIDILIHAGDFTSPEIIDLFREFKCRFVTGNADNNIEALNKECEKLGFDCIGETCEIDADGKKILVLHGYVVSTFREAVASGKYNYIIKGHTHHFEDYIRNNTRVINPGSLSRSEEFTIAVLDTKSDKLEKIIL
ncbi:MAG: YfcE family phosphodiesterase [Spirochaetes bacterium]|nr:YfcE family phosphodiesterase [Spirochaetota bacterium]